jgi:siroheme synthase
MNKQKHITAVGPGPGEAELLTIKGHKAQKNSFLQVIQKKYLEEEFLIFRF